MPPYRFPRPQTRATGSFNMPTGPCTCPPPPLPQRQATKHRCTLLYLYFNGRAAAGHRSWGRFEVRAPRARPLQRAVPPPRTPHRMPRGRPRPAARPPGATLGRRHDRLCGQPPHASGGVPGAGRPRSCGRATRWTSVRRGLAARPVSGASARPCACDERLGLRGRALLQGPPQWASLP